jgi:hypothetical protein
MKFNIGVLIITLFGFGSLGVAGPKTKPCSGLFQSEFNLTKSDRTPASIDDSKKVILEAILKENDPERLKLISKNLLDAATSSDGNREIQLAYLTVLINKGADLKKYLSDCAGGSELFKKQ